MPVSFKFCFSTDRKKLKKRHTSTFFSLSGIHVLIFFVNISTSKACRGKDKSPAAYLNTPQSKESVWVEVSEIPNGIENYNKLIIPHHYFIRRKPLSKGPVGLFGRKRYVKRPY